MKYYQFPLIAVAVLGLVLTPAQTEAATKKPTCELTLTTQQGDVTTHKDADVLLLKGAELTIAWDSDNAKKGVDGDGDTISLSGEETVSPSTTTTYDYKFTGSGSSKKVACSVTAHVVEADITDSTLSTESSKPTISGTAVGTKTVQLIVKKDGETKTLFKSKQIKVKKGKWSAKISKPLADGSYSITLLGTKKYDLNLIATSTLVVGGTSSGSSSSPSSSSVLSVSPVPLLFGSTVAAEGSVPISYLKITNTGKSPATFAGAWVKQYGTAPTSVVSGLEVRDDKGVTRGKSTSVTFGSNGAFAPADVILGAGETRLFTIRATLSSLAASYIGKQLVMSVTSIKTTGSAKGAFPIAGTTWTIK